MEYRLNILGGLKWFAQELAINHWTVTDVVYVLISRFGFEEFSNEDITYWLEQLNRRD